MRPCSRVSVCRNPDIVFARYEKLRRFFSKVTKQVIGIYTKTTNQEDLDETYQTFIKVWERVPYVSTAGVQAVLNFTRHSAAKAAKPEQFIDNSILAELEKGGFVNQLYGR